MSDVNGWLLKDPHFARLIDLGRQLADALDAYVPHEHFFGGNRIARLSEFDVVHVQARLAIRRMLLPGRRYR
jgi:hypothetical protein